MRQFLAWISSVLSFIVFAHAASQRAHDVFNTTLWSMFNSPTQCVEVFLFLSPCIVFLTTTIVYYRFITEYTGEIAGLSVAGLFTALYICERLLVVNTHDWASHLKWVFVLFYSYVWWDAIMVACFLPRAKDQRLAQIDREEIFLLSSLINWPTLFAILFMWAAARHMVAVQASAATVSNYVDGVIAFHLVFASFVCLMTMRFRSPSEFQPAQASNTLTSTVSQLPLAVLDEAAQIVHAAEEVRHPDLDTALHSAVLPNSSSNRFSAEDSKEGSDHLGLDPTISAEGAVIEESALASALTETKQDASEEAPHPIDTNGSKERVVAQDCSNAPPGRNPEELFQDLVPEPRHTQ